MQCLVIAPSYADLSVLRAVLDELGAQTTTTTQLLVGAQLATVSLDEFDFAVALLPGTGPDGAPTVTPPAIYLEMGIVLGRGLALLVLTDAYDQDSPGLGGLASDVWWVADSYDAIKLRLHLNLFAQVAASRRQADISDFRRENLASADQSASDSKIAIPYTPTVDAGVQAFRLEQEVLGLLQNGGALTELSPHDSEVDAAAIIPGTEHILGPILVQLKMLREGSLRRAQHEFSRYVLDRRASLGLLIYSGPRQQPPGPPPESLPIVVLHVDDLRRQVEQGTLARTLIQARNDLVHGRRGDA